MNKSIKAEVREFVEHYIVFYRFVRKIVPTNSYNPTRHSTYLEELAHTIEGNGAWRRLRYQENMKLVLQEIKSDIEDLEKLLV